MAVADCPRFDGVFSPSACLFFYLFTAVTVPAARAQGDRAIAPSDAAMPETVELTPSYVLPAGLGAIAALLLAVSGVAAGILGVFSLFLTVQAATLRLRFTGSSLEIYRGRTMIRDFPYRNWQNWDIFWTHWPTLFFFREVKSLHFLPILFDPHQLRGCLERHNLPVRRSWD